MTTRPRTIAEMQAALGGLMTGESLRRARAYRPDPTDIFISPYAKCGTTWMQQIVHGLRTGGSMEFDEITAAVPWLELAHDMGVDIDAPQAAEPRAFKSHAAWDDIPKGGRYIVVFRDPVDAMVSLYRFFEGWFFEPGTISMEEFGDFYLGRPEGRNYWTHAASWWRQRGRAEVFLIAFETMKRDLGGSVGRVADFMGLPADSPARGIATAQAEFGFMKRHARQFDDHLTRQFRDAACGLPPGGVASKVDRGEAGRGVATVPPALVEAFAARWRETMAREFGLATYDDLRRALEDGRPAA